MNIGKVHSFNAVRNLDLDDLKAYKQYKKEQDSSLDEFDSVRLAYANYQLSGKFVVLQKLLDQWNTTDNNKLLIFSQTKKVLSIIELILVEKNIKFCRLDGDTDVKSRMAIITKFNNAQEVEGGLVVFLLTTRVGSLGINLTSANKVIIFDPDWNPMVDIQATERALRIG